MGLAARRQGRERPRAGRVRPHPRARAARLGGSIENAFRLMPSFEQMVKLGLRQPDAPLATIEQAFNPLDYLFLADRVQIGDGPVAWRPWLIDLPNNDELPAAPLDVPGRPSSMFLRSLAILRGVHRNGDLAREAERTGAGPALAELRSAHDRVHAHAGTACRPSRATTRRRCRASLSTTSRRPRMWSRACRRRRTFRTTPSGGSSQSSTSRSPTRGGWRRRMPSSPATTRSTSGSSATG